MKFKKHSSHLVGKLSRLLIATGVFLIIASTTTARADDKLYVTTILIPPLANGSGTGFVERLAIEAFSRLNYKIEISAVPPERSLVNVDTGIEDVELFRVSGLEKLYPNLRMVQEPLFIMDFSPFTRTSLVEATDWKSLGSWRVGIIRGWKILEKHLSQHPHLKIFNNADKLFEALLKDKIDVAMYGRITGLQHIEQFKNFLQLAGPPLLQKKMHMYLNKKHKALLEPLNQALRNMKQDGTYQKIQSEFDTEIETE